MEWLLFALAAIGAVTVFGWIRESVRGWNHGKAAALRVELLRDIELGNRLAAEDEAMDAAEADHWTDRPKRNSQ